MTWAGKWNSMLKTQHHSWYTKFTFVNLRVIACNSVEGANYELGAHQLEKTKKGESPLWGKISASYHQYDAMEKVNETLAVTRGRFSAKIGNSFCWSTRWDLTENVKYQNKCKHKPVILLSNSTNCYVIVRSHRFLCCWHCSVSFSPVEQSCSTVVITVFTSGRTMALIHRQGPWCL